MGVDLSGKTGGGWDVRMIPPRSRSGRGHRQLPPSQPETTLLASETLKVSLDDARRRWYGAQSLPETVPTAHEAVATAGYIRTLGGVDVYLALRARVKDLKRRDVDAAVESGWLRVVPTVRGCIYLVDRSEVPWSLRIADILSRSRRRREYDKVEIKSDELDRVGEAVLEALEKGPASTSELRKTLGDVARGLGAIGKKVGISSTLPPALRELEFSGRIERTLANGRLDSERYEWRATESNPLDGFPDDPAEIHAHLAAKFFGAVGLGSVDRFATWAGIGKRDARAAADALDLQAVSIDGLPEERMIQGSLDDLVPTAGVSFLPFLDNLMQLQPGLSPLVDPRHHDIAVPTWGPGKGKTLGTANSMAFRAIAVDGEVVGVWEYDPDKEDVVTATFQPVPSAVKKRIDEEAMSVAVFLREEIGRAISFSIDTDDRLRSRAAEVKKLGA